MSRKFLILGGYGNAGRLIAELLLQETEVQLILAGRSSEKANLAAEALNQKFSGHRVDALRVDAADFESLRSTFRQVDLVVVAASTITYVENVAKAALEARIDYLDTQLSSLSKWQTLKSLQEDIKQAGCCFITDGGFHPGVPATLVQYAALLFDRLETAKVASVIQGDWQSWSFSEDTLIEFAKALGEYQPLQWQQGKWIHVGWSGYQEFDFGSPFSKRYCIPMFIEELRILPELVPFLQETGFFVAGFHWFTDYLVIPAGFLLPKISATLVKPFAKILLWSLKTFSKPPFGTMLLLEATGWRGDQPATLRATLFHEDAYLLTAAPVVACLLQYLEGGIRKAGVWCQANVVTPERMLRDVERLGIRVEILHG